MTTLKEGCNCGCGTALADLAGRKKVRGTKGRSKRAREKRNLQKKGTFLLLQEQARAIAKEIRAYKDAHPKQFPKRPKPTKTVQAVACPSEQYTGGCTATTYVHKNGNLRTVQLFKVKSIRKAKAKKTTN